MQKTTAPHGTSSKPFAWIAHPLTPALLLLAVAVILLITLRKGQEWDGDFALYIMNARNIVLGLPYGKTAYLLDSANAINPAAYPPGLPLLFAPVYAFFGVDLVKMKLVCILGLLLFLGVFYRIARSRVPPSFALAVTAAIGLHPFLMESENSPTSEFPFMFFCYGALYVLSRLQEDEPGLPRSRAGLMALAALAVALAYLTRSIGILLFPAAFVVSVFYARRLITATNVSLAGAALLIVLAQLAFPADIGTYVHYFDSFSLHGLVIAVKRYLGVRAALIGKTAVMFPSVGILLGSAILVLAAIGFAERVRRRISIFETFFVMYIVFLIIYPITLDVSRYAMPIWPLLFLYCARGIALCTQRLARLPRQLIAAAVCLMVAALYGIQYASMSFAEIPYSVEARPSRELFDAIQHQIPPGARILTRKPTIVGLYTGHEATIWPEQFTDSELWAFMKNLHIEYVIQDVNHMGVHAGAVDPLDPFIEHNRDRLQPVYHNEWFNVYRAVPAS